MSSESGIDPMLNNTSLPKFDTDEESTQEEATEDETLKECTENETTPPKISKESRHSIGSYIVPTRDRRCGTSFNFGGSRSNRPSLSENALAKSQSEIQVCATNSLSVSQTSRQSLMTFSSSGTFYDHGKKKMDIKVHPKPVQSSVKDTTDFQQMEQGLLQLLEDFHSGKLQAFGQNCTFEKMESVREQQERLARLHFDLNAEQEMSGSHTDEGIKVAKGNLSQLMENLQKLSHSIEQLQSGCVGNEGDK